MCDNPLKKYFDILELKPDASLQEIEQTYKHLKSLYSSDSSILSSLVEDLSDKKSMVILEKIEEAYHVLHKHLQKEKREKFYETKRHVANKQIPEFERYSGNALRITREVLGVDLEEIAFSSRIAIKSLQCIEEENYSQLPPKAYIRAFVKKYAEFLCLDASKVVEDYMLRYERTIKGKRKK